MGRPTHAESCRATLKPQASLSSGEVTVASGGLRPGQALMQSGIYLLVRVVSPSAGHQTWMRNWDGDG